MAMEKRNLWSASADANQVEAETILYLPSMSACGRKRTLISAVFGDLNGRFGEKRTLRYSFRSDLMSTQFAHI